MALTLKFKVSLNIRFQILKSNITNRANAFAQTLDETGYFVEISDYLLYKETLRKEFYFTMFDSFFNNNTREYLRNAVPPSCQFNLLSEVRHG